MPRLAGRRRPLIGGLLFLAAVLPSPAWCQQPAGGTTKPSAAGPAPTGGPAPTTEPAPITEPGPAAPVAPVAPVAPGTPEISQPVPVIPDPLLIPPLTVPSAPQRFLPSTAAGVAPAARFQLLPTISLSEEYTDNFNLTARNKQSNFRSTVSPGLGLSINGAFLKGLVAYTFSPSYDSSIDEISLFHSLIGQVAWEVTPLWKLTVADTLTQSDQANQADSLGLRQRRQKFTSDTLSLSSDYLFGRVATRQTYQLLTFSDEEGQDTKTHTVGLSATAPIYRTNSLSAGYEYLSSSTSGNRNPSTSASAGLSSVTGSSDVTGHKLSASVSRTINTLRTVGVTSSYALRSVTSDTGDTEFRLWNASVVNDYELPGRLRLHSTLGLSGVTTDTGQSSGPNLSTLSSLTYQFARAVVTVSVDRGFSETFSEGENFGLVETEGVRASLLYPFTPSLTGTVEGSYRHNKQTGIVGTSNANQDTKSWGGSLGLSWRILRGLLLDVTYTYTRQTGSDDNQTGTGSGMTTINNSYTENRVRAALSLSF